MDKMVKESDGSTFKFCAIHDMLSPVLQSAGFCCQAAGDVSWQMLTYSRNDFVLCT